MKPFEEALDDLINDHLTFPGNEEAAYEEVVSALELKLMAMREEENSKKAE